MFYDGLKRICSSKGISVTVLTKELCISSGNTGAWKNGGTPRIKLLKIADYFKVSPDELLGIKKEPATVELSPIQEELFNIILNLDADRQKQALDFLRFLKNQ